MHISIDYGSKLAGTTAICWAENKKIKIAQSEKKKDADLFIQKYISELKPDIVFIDAPLSLPNVYTGKGDDYFYRKCDKELKAMSPMFLGGLTARAMKLRSHFPDVIFHEIYPAQLRRIIFPDATFYKKERLEEFCELMENILPFPFSENPKNWHQMDSALAWISGWRYKKGEAKIYGEKKEGIIIV